MLLCAANIALKYCRFKKKAKEIAKNGLRDYYAGDTVGREITRIVIVDVQFPFSANFRISLQKRIALWTSCWSSAG